MKENYFLFQRVLENINLLNKKKCNRRLIKNDQNNQIEHKSAKALSRYLGKSTEASDGNRLNGNGNGGGKPTSLHGNKRKFVASSKIIDESEIWEKRLGELPSDSKKSF